MTSTTCRRAAALLFALLHGGLAQAYGGGGGGGGSSCAEPEFYQPQPAAQATVPALAEFSIHASANTDLATLDLQIDGVPRQPTLSPERSGDTLITVKLDPPLANAGRARVTLRARSRDGCETFLPIYINIKP